MIRVSGRDMRRFGYVRKRGTADFSSPRVLSISVWQPVPPRFDTRMACPWQPNPEPHMAAQEALPDGMREAASDVCLIAHERVETKQAAGKAPARPGFDDMGPGCCVARLANMRLLFDAVRALHPGPSRPKRGSWRALDQAAKMRRHSSALT